MILFRICLISVILFSVARADDWPQWRGPNRNGVTKEKLAISADSKIHIQWKKSLGIGGYSSIVIAAGHAYTTFSDGLSDYAICFDSESGDEKYSLISRDSL